MKKTPLGNRIITKPQIGWAQKRQQRFDFINEQLRLERKAEVKFTELNDAMREYYEVFGHKLKPLSPRPVLSPGGGGNSLTFMTGVIMSGHFLRPPNMLTNF